MKIHFLLALTAMFFCTYTTYGEQKPNIVFVMIDDFGYADSGAYGAEDIKTPGIDALAAGGTKFSNFYANAPVCSPTRCAFITGRWQQRSGFEWALGYGGTNFQLKNGKYESVSDIHGVGLLPTEKSLPKLLQKAGYRTGAFGKWHLGSKEEFNPMKHGFDEYYGPLLGHCDYFTYKYYDGTYSLREGTEVVQDSGYLTTNINKRAVDFIEHHSDSPFFMYVPHMAVHSPYQQANKKAEPITKANLNNGNRADYAAMVEEIDKGIQMIIAKLKEKKLLENTLVVVSSDNGGAHFSDNTPLFHRKTTLF